MRSWILLIILAVEACAPAVVAPPPFAASQPTDRYRLSVEAQPPSEYVWMTIDDAYAEAFDREMERRKSEKRIIVAETKADIAQAQADQWKSQTWVDRHGFVLGMATGGAASMLLVILAIWAASALARH